MAEQKKQTSKVKNKITKIGDYPIKADAYAIILHDEQFGYDVLPELQNMLNEGELFSNSLAPYQRLYWSMAASADQKLEGEEGWNKFKRAIAIKDLLDLRDEIVAAAFFNLETEEVGK